MDSQDMKNLVRYIGGEDNITFYYHCITRLRFEVVNQEKVSLDKINSLKAVKTAKFQGKELQIIIGADVQKYFNILTAIIGPKETAKANVDQKTQVKWAPSVGINKLMDILSGVFVPILPAVTGAGMIKSLLALLTAFNLVDMTSDIYQVLNLMADSAFYFLPFLLAVTSARKFGVNEFLALMVSGSLMYPLLIEGVTEGLPGLVFLGIKIPFVNYSTSVIPVVLGVYLLSVVYKTLDRFIPKSFSLLVTSTLSILITLPLILGFIAPLGFYGGNALSGFISWIFTVSGPLAGLVIGATVPLIVMTGMHYAVNPIVLQNLSKMKYDFLAPLFFISNISQAGAALGVGVKTKNLEQKNLAFSTGISALFGITEPAMYGVNLHEKIPFKIALASSGIGGFVASLLGVKVFSFVMPGLTGLPAYIDKGANIYFILSALLLSFLFSFIGTILFWKERKVDEQANEEQSVVTELDTDTFDFVVPITGNYCDLAQVPDEIFSERIMGEGFAIEPTANEVYAPVTGVVNVISETKHAIGIVSTEGIEVLLHLGINTVRLAGEGFEISVSQGDKVVKGQKIADVNWSYIESQKLSPLTPIIFTNLKTLPTNLTCQKSGTKLVANTPILTN